MKTNAKARNIFMAAGVTALLLGNIHSASAVTMSTPLIFSDCGSGVSCASFMNNVSGSFINSYTFDITDTSGFGAAALNLDFTTFASIAGFNMSLWQGSTNLANGTIFNYPNLGSGSYALNITGNTGASGGFYAGVAMLAPVPEASTWLMMLAGISLVGLALHRKTRSDDLITA